MTVTSAASPIWATQLSYVPLTNLQFLVLLPTIVIVGAQKQWSWISDVIQSLLLLTSRIIVQYRDGLVIFYT